MLLLLAASLALPFHHGATFALRPRSVARDLTENGGRHPAVPRSPSRLSRLLSKHKPFCVKKHTFAVCRLATSVLQSAHS
jgi:hypothetical protein